MSIRFLSTAEWRLLRRVRLAALADSPQSFLSAYDRERRFGQGEWEHELRRGEWAVWAEADRVHALLGATPEPDVAEHERYLSYLWVHPCCRRTGLATKLVHAMLDRLRTLDTTRVWLWVLDGNEAATALYRQLGFVPIGDRQPLRHDPTRSEQRLTREVR